MNRAEMVLSAREARRVHVDSYADGELVSFDGIVDDRGDSAWALPLFDACGMFGSGWGPTLTATIDNPSGEPDTDRAIDKAAKLVAALDAPTRALVYAILHAEGLRIVPGSYTEQFRKARAK